jgi:hypothetical protein
MLTFLVIALLVAGCTALVVRTLTLPWPQRVSWLMASNALSHWSLAAEPLLMREVVVVDVCRHGDELVVDVRAPGSRHDTTLALVGDGAAAAEAHAVCWRSAGTSLLLIGDGATAPASLHGPARVLSGFRLAGADDGSRRPHR